MHEQRIRGAYSIRRRNALVLPGMKRAKALSLCMFLLSLRLDREIVLVSAEEPENRVEHNSANVASGFLVDVEYIGAGRGSLTRKLRRLWP